VGLSLARGLGLSLTQPGEAVIAGSLGPCQRSRLHETEGGDSWWRGAMPGGGSDGEALR
jgi:hypothetical protein